MPQKRLLKGIISVKESEKKQNYGSERYRNLHDNEKGKKSENMTVNSTTIFQCLAKFWIFFQANV